MISRVHCIGRRFCAILEEGAYVRIFSLISEHYLLSIKHMKILEYHCQDLDGQGWDFDRVKFGNINLLVGDTATGKTCLLNTIFNLGRFVVCDHGVCGVWLILLPLLFC
jgi:hypothetical protein